MGSCKVWFSIHWHSVEIFDNSCTKIHFGYFLTFELFRNVLFHFQIFVNCIHIYFVDFQFNLIVIREYTLYNLHHVKLIETYFMVELGKSSVCD